MNQELLALTIGELSIRHPAFTDFLATTDANGAKPGRTLQSWLSGLSDDRLSHIGMDRAQVLAHVEALAVELDALHAPAGPALRSLTILGGIDKNGAEERLELVLEAGDVLCIVGPTGSGKSRLLADIECLAQGDTPSGRRILIDGVPPDPKRRWAGSGKLVAQLSQNMNFVVDLAVGEFIAMHADCRMVSDRDAVVREVIACANDLAGEQFSAEVSLTQLSGGQTRALMIADAALLSASPIVLIDEIENAGIDRKRALDLLVAREKIVLISTHDPILALIGDRRIVIGNGAVTAIIETSAREKANLVALDRIDRGLMQLRQQLRYGGRIDLLPSFTLSDNQTVQSPPQQKVPPMDAITLLLERRSCSALQAPAPEGDALDIILKAALRVPDFQNLKPYEFILVKDDGLDRLGALLEQAAIASGQRPEIIERAPTMPHRAPLLVIVVARTRDHKLVPRFEQQLTAGCAVMAMQMAAVAQGFSGIWRSGWPMFDRGLHEGLGLGADDQIVGFLYLGTPSRKPEPVPVVDASQYSRWL
jgi:ABC-type lipoprotein export system ATPase subunit/nitroreductase